jgi:methionine-rich copper-binding protein CopC
MTFRHLYFTACLAAGFALFSGAALSHSKKETTMPVDGAVLEATPEVIAMTFDKPMRLTLVQLTNSDGAAVNMTRTDGMAPVTKFEATPSEMEPGAYTLEWRGLSSDGHPMEGRFSFQIAD